MSHKSPVSVVVILGNDHSQAVAKSFANDPSRFTLLGVVARQAGRTDGFSERWTSLRAAIEQTGPETIFVDCSGKGRRLVYARQLLAAGKMFVSIGHRNGSSTKGITVQAPFVADHEIQRDKVFTRALQDYAYKNFPRCRSDFQPVQLVSTAKYDSRDALIEGYQAAVKFLAITYENVEKFPHGITRRAFTASDVHRYTNPAAVYSHLLDLGVRSR